MNTTLVNTYGNETILATASQEGGEWMRLLKTWCNEVNSRDMNTAKTEEIIQFLEKFYMIHEKLHHRIILILACTMDDPTSLEELECINTLNNQLLEEQKHVTSIIQSLRSKTLFGELRTTWNIDDYMKFVNKIVEDINLDWSVIPSGGLIYDPVDSLTDN